MTEVTSSEASPGRPPILLALIEAQRRAPVVQTLALIVIFAYGAATLEGFGEWPSIKTMLALGSLLALAALGQTMVMILGGLDLSIPGFIVLGAIVVSKLYGSDGWPAFAAILVPVLIAAVLGALTGWICHHFRIQPLIVTLGVGGLAAGGAIAWSEARVTGTAPSFLTDISSPASKTFGFIDIPPIVVITAVVTIIMAVILHRTVAGRRLYATGANPRAAELARFKTQYIWVAVFAASAVIATIVGILLAGFSGADASIGEPYLFQGLTAVIVGGTTIMGARGDFTHTVVGALVLTALTTILVGNNVDTATNQIIFGLLILVVVAGYGRDRRLRDRL